MLKIWSKTILESFLVSILILILGCINASGSPKEDLDKYLQPTQYCVSELNLGFKVTKSILELLNREYYPESKLVSELIFKGTKLLDVIMSLCLAESVERNLTIGDIHRALYDLVSKFGEEVVLRAQYAITGSSVIFVFNLVVGAAISYGIKKFYDLSTNSALRQQLETYLSKRRAGASHEEIMNCVRIAKSDGKFPLGYPFCEVTGGNLYLQTDGFFYGASVNKTPRGHTPEMVFGYGNRLWEAKQSESLSKSYDEYKKDSQSILEEIKKAISKILSGSGSDIIKVLLTKGWNQLFSTLDRRIKPSEITGCNISPKVHWEDSQKKWQVSDAVYQYYINWIDVQENCTGTVTVEAPLQSFAFSKSGWAPISSTLSWDEIKGDCKLTDGPVYFADNPKRWVKISTTTPMDPLKAYWVQVARACRTIDYTGATFDASIGPIIDDTIPPIEPIAPTENFVVCATGVDKIIDDLEIVEILGAWQKQRDYQGCGVPTDDDYMRALGAWIKRQPVDGGPPTPTPAIDNPPVVTIVTPEDGATVSGIVNITIQARDDFGIKEWTVDIEDGLCSQEINAPYPTLIERGCGPWKSYVYSAGTIRAIS